MIKPFVTSDLGIRRIALGIVLFLFVYEIYVVGANYSNYFAVLAEFETFWFAVAACVFFLLSFYLFYFWIRTGIAASWPYKAIFLSIFIVSVIAEYGYQKALGRFSDPQDIETAVFATGEQQITSLLMYLNGKAAVPCFIIVLLFVFVRAAKPKGLRESLIANGLLIVSFALFPFLVSQRFPTISTNAFVRTATEFLVAGRSPQVNGARM